MIIGTTPIQDYPRLPKELLTEEEAADYLQIRMQTLRQWRSGYRKKEKIPYLKVGRAVRYRKADLIAWTVSRVGETERTKEAAVKAREEQMRELRTKYQRQGTTQPKSQTRSSTGTMRAAGTISQTLQGERHKEGNNEPPTALNDAVRKR